MGRQGSRESYGHVCCRSICRPILRARGCRLDLLGFDYLREDAACVIFMRVFTNSCTGRGLSRCGSVHDARDIYVRPSGPNNPSPIQSDKQPLSPVLLATKAHKLRQSTKDDRYYAPMEANTLPLGQRVESTLSKPFKLLFLEPMMMATTLYMSVRS